MSVGAQQRIDDLLWRCTLGRPNVARHIALRSKRGAIVVIALIACLIGRARKAGRSIARGCGPLVNAVLAAWD